MLKNPIPNGGAKRGQSTASLRPPTSEHELTRATNAASEPVFKAIWNNPEDDAYDTAFARL